MKHLVSKLLVGRQLLILGFGREGQSTLRYFEREFPGLPISIADRNARLKEQPVRAHEDRPISWYLGEDYLQCITGNHLVIKSPGVKIPGGFPLPEGTMVTSQTRLMLEAFHRQIIGVTGTKGKSTTTSLIRHILDKAGFPSLLVGNIGRPPFDYLDLIDRETKIVYEMSSHQLEDTILAPHISVLLNLFPEHLDRYPTLDDYYNAKMRILTGQRDRDVFIYNEDIPEICRRTGTGRLNRLFYSFSGNGAVDNGSYLSGSRVVVSMGGNSRTLLEIPDELPLKGRHNRMNILAAVLAALSSGVPDEAIRQGIVSFKGLEHRLEFVGEFRGIRFYNDSIATIPEATIAAVEALPDTDTLILGGFDRGLEYGLLADFLCGSGVRNLIFVGKAGERMLGVFRLKNCDGKSLYPVVSLHQAVEQAAAVTQAGKICLLSPAAASYDSFHNFEERGQVYKKLAGSLKPPASNQL